MNRFISSNKYILGILCFSVLFRLISINQSLWLDETTTAMASNMTLGDLFNKFLPGDFHPPLYYLFMKIWISVFGYSEIALRIPSIIFGVITIYLIYLIAKKFIDQKTGIIASALAATSGLLIYYSQEARMYSLAAMLVCLSIFLYLQKKWIYLGIILAIVGLTDYVALFIVPVLVMAEYKYFKRIFLSLIPLIIAFGLWMPTFLVQLKQGFLQHGTPWWELLGTMTLKNMLLIPTKFILGRISFDNKFIYGAIVLLFCLFIVFLLYKAKNANRVIWSWLFVPIIIGLMVSLKIPTLSYFRFLFCLPAFYILISVGIEKSGKYKYIFLCLIIGINIFSSGYYLINYKFHREDWREAAAMIGTDEIVLPGDSQKEALVYYGKADQITKNPTKDTIWLSRYVWEVVDPGNLTELKVNSLGYNKATEYHFNGVVFWKYNK
jgi:4-amino-4-deoxy-L-arabinose transferase-like glycosyltransferase